MIRELVFNPSNILRKANRELTLEEIKSKEVEDLIQDMYDTMDANNGVGLAANQIGYGCRIFVIRKSKNKYMHFINPQIVWHSKYTATGIEGCLSCIGDKVQVTRHKQVTVSYYDTKGRKQLWKANTGIMSACVQHEIDHLNGKLIIDYLKSNKDTL